MANASMLRVKRELREQMEVVHTINVGLNGPRGNLQLDRMGFLVSIAWNRGIPESDNELWFTVRATDKSHITGDRFEVVFTTVPCRQEHRREPACTSGSFYSQFKTKFEPTTPVRILVTITKMRRMTEGRCCLSDDESYLRSKKIVTDLYASLETTGDVLVTTAFGSVYKAHRVILESQSPIFKAMLENESHISLTFEDSVVSALIEFLYLGWTDNSSTNITDLLKLACGCDIQELVEACWKRLVKSLDIDNCVEVLILAKDFGDREGIYKKKVGRFVVENFRDLRGTEEHAALVKDHPELYLEICSLEF